MTTTAPIAVKFIEPPTPGHVSVEDQHEVTIWGNVSVQIHVNIKTGEVKSIYLALDEFGREDSISGPEYSVDSEGEEHCATYEDSMATAYTEHEEFALQTLYAFIERDHARGIVVKLDSQDLS